MKTILLPVDFTKHSEKALEFAIRIAEKSGAKIIVAHCFYVPVMDINVPGEMLQEIYDGEKEETEKALINYCQKITSHTSSNGHPLTAEFIAGQNFPVSEILHLIKEREVDLVIMGTRGEDHLWGFFESTTLEVLKKSKCPVLVVHEKSIYKEFRKIYLALEEMKEDLLSIKSLIPLARLYNGKISVVHVDKVTEYAEDLKEIKELREDSEIFLSGIKEQYNYSDISYRSSISGDTFLKMIEIVEKEQPNLLVLVRHQRNWLESFFHKSLVKYVLKTTTIPLLIIHP